MFCVFFFFKQKTAYEMRISDWSSDVCSSDLQGDGHTLRADVTIGANFDDGRGNAVFSVGYQQADPIYQGAREHGLFALSSASGGGGGSGTSVPSRFSLPCMGTRQVNAEIGMSSSRERVCAYG